MALSDIRPACLPVCVLIPASEHVTGDHTERNTSGLEMTGSTVSPVDLEQCSHLLDGSPGKSPSSSVPWVPHLHDREDNNTSGTVLW